MTVYALRRVLALSALAVLLVTAAWVVNVASANAETDACYEQVPYIERIYEQPTYVTEHQVAKHTRTRTKSRGQWSDWSAPEVWSPLSHEAWVTDIAAPVWAPHASGFGWERQWAVLPTGTTRQVQSGTESSGWTRTELAAPWVLVDQRDGTEDGPQVPCGQQPPAEQREDEVVDCESGLVTSRTWETPYMLIAFEWVPGAEVLVASSQRETGEECPTPTTVPPTSTTIVYECDGDGDGVNEHSYNDPSDGVCAEEAPPTTVPAPPAKVVETQPAAETLPVTGRGLDLAIFGATALAIGVVLRAFGRRLA